MDYLSIRELAEATGYTRQHIHRIIKAGVVRVEKVSEKKIAVPITEANKIIEQAKSELAEYLRLNIDFSKVNERFIKDYVKKLGDIPLTAEGDLKLLNLYILTKGFRTHSAILTLCRQGHGESAMALVRQLIEADASLRWVYKDKTEHRVKLFAQHVVHQKMRALTQSYQDERMRISISERRVNPEPYDIDIRELNELKKRLSESGSGGHFWHRLGSLEELIKDAGLPQHYSVYLTLLNEFIHTNPVDLDHYVSLEEGELLLMLGPGPESVKEALIMGFHFAFSILDFLNDRESLGYDNNLEKLAKAYEKTGEIGTEAEAS